MRRTFPLLAALAIASVSTSYAAEEQPKPTPVAESVAEPALKPAQPAAEKSDAEALQAEPAVDPTAVPEGDANYDLLGEFVGEIKTEAGAESSVLGLQIRPIGGGRFEALQYLGGLPGDGALQTTVEDEENENRDGDHEDGDEEERQAKILQLIGQRSGDTLVLSGGPWAIFADSRGCTLIDKEGKLLGRLERIRRLSPTLGATPPEGAMVLFDGTNTEQFSTAAMTEDGLLKQGADVKQMFQDFNLHVEFRLPFMPEQQDQARGNSGCYLQSRYELQILDSFALLPVFNGCSSIYRTKSPDVNMCLPPLQWQTYDLIFTAPRWAADGSKVSNARLTVWHNGVKTQDDVELQTKTGAGKPEEPNLQPIRFQNHKDQVRFRNIWIIDRGLASVEEFPVLGAPEESSEAAVAAE
ncbi:3-keto-disaccharide hydrolase [Aureliella helgolandensis]|uniref:3-keto-alpha-glucoside-1,2-lyase/3-keto-2-hydroxy-glucal hydratase domain-containing protein n=1 Tax=Aureliella helgolandensis TaxID=2527968 RepID=A0A518G6D4_9BACT|nr:DUF1080 domain-containing protein [Aureliella helgolandensis]QDV24139.1 hypothetical protein Q31a_24520 [Aureliella helgolandensis]